MSAKSKQNTRGNGDDSDKVQSSTTGPISAHVEGQISVPLPGVPSAAELPEQWHSNNLFRANGLSASSTGRTTQPQAGVNPDGYFSQGKEVPSQASTSVPVQNQHTDSFTGQHASQVNLVGSPRVRSSRSVTLQRMQKSFKKAAFMSKRTSDHVWGCIPGMLVMPVLSIVFMCVMLAAILPVYFSYKSNIESGTVVAFPSNMTEANMRQFQGTILVVRVVSIDADQFSMSTHVQATTGGFYADRSVYGIADIPAGRILSVIAGSQSFKRLPGDTMGQETLEFFMTEEVKLVDYPFDQYHVEFDVQVLVVPDITDSGGGDYALSTQDIWRMPANMIMYTARQGWDLHTTMSRTPDTGPKDQAVRVEVRIRRSSSTRFFSVFVVILNWCISLAIVMLTLDYLVLNKREVGYEVPSLTVGLLFALPFVRDVQPGVPAIGCTVDILGFFWNMVLIALCTVLLLSSIMAQQHAAWKRQQRRHVVAAGGLSFSSDAA